MKLLFPSLLLSFSLCVESALTKNILFIGVDDLRPDIASIYGQSEVKTPNLDKFISTSTTFRRSYCQIALCSPSRTSLLTGLRPDTTKVWSIGPYFRETMGDKGNSVVTLPQYFKLQGFYTIGVGKIFHPGTSSGGPSSSEGGGDGGWPFDPINGSWSEPYFFCDQFYNGTFQSPAMQNLPNAREANAGCVQSDACIECLRKADSYSGKHSWRGAKCDASCYPDGAVADEAVKRLNELKDMSEPFFLAVGFKRPHLGWMAPQSYFDLYDVNNVSLAQHRMPPKDMPRVAFSQNGEMCGMDDVQCEKDENGYELVPESRHAELRRAYYAAVSFMDSQLGRVLDALEETGLDQNTAVVFWGDHGYQLGEHGLWCKITNFELATRVPLVMRLPNHTNPGSESTALVSLLDIYPTLLDIAGLPPNPSLEGRSFRSLLTDSSSDDTSSSSFNVSFSQFLRPNNTMGLSVRTSQYRFTWWGEFNTTSSNPIWSEPSELELYDHINDSGTDFDAYENINVAEDNPEIVSEMMGLLRP